MRFLTSLGSDRLISHPRLDGARIREHRCFHCRRPFRLEYSPKALQDCFGRYAILPAALGLGVFALAYSASGNDAPTALGAAVLAVLSVWPFLVSWIKYQSAEFHAG